MDPNVCVLLADSSKNSRKAMALLTNARIPFSVITPNDPGREMRSAPQLYTSRGTVTDLESIEIWVKQHGHTNGDGALGE
jgi:hypothetical protein